VTLFRGEANKWPLDGVLYKIDNNGVLEKGVDMENDSGFLRIKKRKILMKFRKPLPLAVLLFCASIVLLFGPATLIQAADYNGHDIDGETYSATAFSNETGEYYTVQVEFSGDEATMQFKNGGKREITLDDEEIDDPHSISGTDSDGVSWDLDVDGLD